MQIMGTEINMDTLTPCHKTDAPSCLTIFQMPSMQDLHGHCHVHLLTFGYESRMNGKFGLQAYESKLHACNHNNLGTHGICLHSSLLLTTSGCCRHLDSA